MTAVVVIPAIDLFGGRCVRLVKGDYGTPTIYSDNPLEVVDEFVAAGAEHLHLVDLDAARGIGDNRAVIESIVRKHMLEIQVAGGIRTAEAVD
ncbi:MAG TPA: HisA/HisF-related TIM barrel protein, partial [Candidatus Acidoferrum sp.]|nr:HisA/HisF-related TIM barrel protein [Candidatus Acidoferrum sp.]